MRHHAWPALGKGQAGRTVLSTVLLCSLVLTLAVFGLSPRGHSQTATLIGIADTYLRQGSANKNQGDETFLRVRQSGKNRALIRFDQTAILATVGAGSLASATLELTVEKATNWGSEGRTVDIHRLMADWSELGATWNCPDDTTPSNSSPNCAAQWDGGLFAEDATDSLLHTNDLSGTVQFDVTADVQAFLSGTANFGWLIKKQDEGQNGLVECTSRDGMLGQEPRLVLVVESATNDPVSPALTITAPTDPILVNAPTQEIVVEYTDKGSGVDLSTLQVMVDTTDITAACTAGPATAVCTPAALSEGLHTITAEVQDIFGNLATASHTFELLLGAGPHIAILSVSADTYLKQGQPNQNQSAETFLRVRQSGNNRALVKFDQTELETLIGDGTLISATLELFIEDNGNNWGSTGRTVDVHRLTEEWTELGATWHCADDTDPTDQQANCNPQWDGGLFAAPPTDSVLHTKAQLGLVHFDVTADVAAFLTGTPNYGWLLKKTQEGQSGRVEYTAWEGTVDQEPRLRVVFETADDTPPTITLTAPQAGLVTNQASQTLTGSVSEAATLTSNGQAVSLDASLSFSHPVTLQEGLNTFTLVATDAAGNSGQLTISLSLDTAPPPVPDSGLISVGAVTNGQVTVSGASGSVEGGAQVTLTNTRTGETVTVTAATDGSFSALLAAEAGDSLSIVATDMAGNASPTGAVQVASDVSVTITEPQDGASITQNWVLVRGSLEGPENTGITVNGVVAVVHDGIFVANDVPLAAGTNTLTATATTLPGQTATDAVTITSQGETPILEVKALPSSGIAPLEVRFEYTFNSVETINTISIDFDGDGTDDFTTTDPAAELVHTYTTQGVFLVRLRLTDQQGTVHDTQVAIVVQDVAALDVMFKALWNDMNAALVAGDKATAMQFLTATAQAKYGPVFDALLSHMPEIIASYSPFQQVSISAEIGEYALTRIIDGQNRLFLVYFLKDSDGVWRLEAM